MQHSPDGAEYVVVSDCTLAEGMYTIITSTDGDCHAVKRISRQTNMSITHKNVMSSHTRLRLMEVRDEYNTHFVMYLVASGKHNIYSAVHQGRRHIVSRH